jgi:branched-chain amino acid aminotransferase
MSNYKRLEISNDLADKIKNTTLPDSLGFGLVRTPLMAISKFSNGTWSEPVIQPWEAIELDPSAKVLHYGQAIFEGMKAYKGSEGKPVLFRPLENYKRFNKSADRMAMPNISEEIFMSSVDSIVSHQESLIPTNPGESLYLRPFMVASGLGIGLAPSTEYLFMVIASPSGAYFAADNVSVLIERNDCRAAPGGTGAAKAAGNYGASIQSAMKAKKLGYHQTLWLDASNHKNIEELSGMNFFAVVDGELYTPKLTDTILAGITRDSLIELARAEGYKVHEVTLEVDDLIEKIKAGSCSELFACGTAAVITPVAELGEVDGTRYKVEHSYGPVSKKLRERLTGIQEKGDSAPEGWVYKVN